MSALIDDAGHYRSSNVGVMNGEVVVHVAPPANRVPVLMGDLLSWLVSTEQHSLIVSSVFHYEFEFIHPFSDGKGRLGRLWQSLSRMLCQHDTLGSSDRRVMQYF